MRIEKTIEEWTPMIANLLERESARVPKGKGTMDEIDFWKDRNSTFSAVIEQLQRPLAKKMLMVMELTDTPIWQAFKTVHNELQKQQEESKVFNLYSFTHIRTMSNF